MVKKIVLFTQLSLALFGGEVFDLYRSGGMAAIQKEIDRGLGTTLFWKEKLSTKDLRFGYYEAIGSLLVCEKENASLALYQKETKNGKENFTRIKTIPAFTGKFEGDKTQEGDRKTPIGAYTLTQKLNTVDPFYGPMAFVTSYPNLYDRIRDKKGDGIWIHGLPISGDRDSFTKGCIAIDNNELINLDKRIDPKNALLLIDTKLKNKSNIAYDAIIAGVYQWRHAWKYNDFHAYISFYDTTFVRHDGMEYFDFKNYKQRIFDRKETKEILFSNINITPYPGGRPNLFMVTFDEIYSSEKHNFSGAKTLMLLLNTDNSISIISEQ